ncbi:hypothetical protein, partial [uncultured Campylobacter sp.]|uniref:hypothetical protein n=1 Tax=uncultured Campylobacter sp. TaxID=218934 RepID=UPI002604934E
ANFKFCRYAASQSVKFNPQAAAKVKSNLLNPKCPTTEAKSKISKRAICTHKQNRRLIRVHQIGGDIMPQNGGSLELLRSKFTPMRAAISTIISRE